MQWGLIKLRKEHKVSQNEMARHLKMNLRTYGMKERGETEFKVSEMIEIHKYFGVTLDEIFLPPDCILNANEKNRA